jgi:Tol biopolymer transport system component/DNA-binding winged helix-turn-helix (wHTH) protein
MTGKAGATGKETLYFGPFAFDIDACRLSREGVDLHLTPKAAAVLCHMLRNPGALITKDEFLEAVWEGVHVREESLTQAISVIRNTLGDSAQSPQFIQTVSGEGYRFIGEVSASPPGGRGSESADSAEESGGIAFPKPATSATVSRTRKTWRLTREVLASAAAVVIAMGIVAWLWRPPAEDPTTAPDFAPVTSYPGYENYPALSPDGRQVAFMWNDGDFQRLYVQFVSGSDPLLLAEANWGDPAWDPDGERIAYMRDYEPPPGEEVSPGLEIRTVTALGTDDRREALTSSTQTGLDWSPDGRFLAFSDRARPGERVNIFFLALETGARHQVTFHGPDEPTFARSPSFSPDGRQLAFIREEAASSGGGYVYIQSLDGEGKPVGEPQLLASPDGFLEDLDWTADGSAVVYSGGPSDDDNLYLTAAPLDGSRPYRLAAGERARGFSIVGGRLLYSARRDDIDLWRIGGPAAEEPGAPQRWASSTRHEFFPDYSPDGEHVAFISGRSGSWEVWVADADGNYPRQLSDLGHATRPQFAPDGSMIAFSSWVPGQISDVWVVDPAGGAPRNLTRDEFRDAIPGWSEDSKFIYFQSVRPAHGTPWAIWRISRDGGDPTLITECEDDGPRHCFRPLHFNGRLYVSRRGRIVRLAEDGGEATTLIDYPISNDAWDLWRGKLVFIEHDSPESAAIKIFDPETRDLRTHAVVPKQGRGWVLAEGTLAVSPDGQHILYSAKARPGGADLIRVDNFR